MASSSSLVSRVAEMTTCPICIEDFNDPRLLDCGHSFCCRCLQRHCRDKRSGAKAQCPLCRIEFRIPSTGIEGLRSSFFLQELIDAKRASAERAGAEPCEVCSTGEQFVRATVCCVDCSQKLCERCSLPHKRWRGGAHDVRPIDDELSRKLLVAVEENVEKLTIRGKPEFVFLISMT